MATAAHTTVSGSEHQQLLSDLFHALNQPLTTLRCSLELALLQPRTVEQYRDNTQVALEQAERISRIAVGIRELLAADDPGDHRRVLALDSCLKEAVGDLLPVAESAEVRLSLNGDCPCFVLFEAERLRRAIFHLLEFVLGCTGAGAVVNIEVKKNNGEAALALATTGGERFCHESRNEDPAGDSSQAKEQELERRLWLAIASRIFQAAGGALHAQDNGERLCLQVRLPLAASSVMAGNG